MYLRLALQIGGVPDHCPIFCPGTLTHCRIMLPIKSYPEKLLENVFYFCFEFKVKVIH